MSCVRIGLFVDKNMIVMLFQLFPLVQILSLTHCITYTSNNNLK